MGIHLVTYLVIQRCLLDTYYMPGPWPSAEHANQVSGPSESHIELVVPCVKP